MSYPLTLQEYTPQFKGRPVPPMLVKLLEWQATQPREFYTRTFELEVFEIDPMAALVMGDAYEQIIPFARGENYCNGFYFWVRNEKVQLSSSPIIMFDGDDNFILVARNLTDFLLASLSNRRFHGTTTAMSDLRQLAARHTPEQLAEFPWNMHSPSNVLAGINLSEGDPDTQVSHGGYRDVDDEEGQSPLIGAYEGFLRNKLGIELPLPEFLPPDYLTTPANTFAKLSYFTTQQSLRAQFDLWQEGFPKRHHQLIDRFGLRWKRRPGLRQFQSTLALIDMQFHARCLVGLEPDHKRMNREKFPATIDVDPDPEQSGVFSFSVYSLPLPNKREMAAQLLRQPGRARLIEYDEETGRGTFTFTKPGPTPCGRCDLIGGDSMLSLNIFGMNRLTRKRWRFLLFAFILRWSFSA